MILMIAVIVVMIIFPMIRAGFMIGRNSEAPGLFCSLLADLLVVILGVRLVTMFIS